MNIFITGGSRGIGRELVKAFLKKGCNVCFTYNKSKEAADELEKEGAIAVQADFAKAENCIRAAREGLEKLGTVDVVINNAGISQQSLFTDISDEDWELMTAVNYSAPFYITRTLLPQMINRKNGRIINISSMWGVCGASCEVHYSAAKAGLIGMTKALAAELAPSGITVNAIAPGVIKTDMYTMLSPETQELVSSEIPAGRIGTPEDIARAALFLAEPAASYITGQVLGVNGGMVI